MSDKEMEPDLEAQADQTAQPPPEVADLEDASEDTMKNTIETMTFAEKVKEAKKFNLLDYIKEGMWIDAKDSVNAWCVAQVVSETDRHVRVHFDGWAARYDDWHRTTGQKIAPFRQNTFGYTGQKKVALR